MKHQIFINKMIKELENENLAIFAGAGLSIPSGMPDWKGLIKSFAEELNLDIEKEYDLVSLMQYYVNEKNGRNNISQKIFESFDSTELTENHKILARLPIKTYWTINYDSLIETALKEEKKIVDIKYTLKQLTTTKPKRDVILYKMHGDKEHATETIILKDEYESYFLKYSPFIDNLKGDLISKTFIFIGISFNDPNLEYVLSRIRVDYERDRRTHYCFFKQIKTPEYDKLKQEYFIKDLKRFGIETVFVDEYSEITEILKNIEQGLNRRNIFISGSASTYTPFDEKEAQNLITKLSSELIKENYNLITGFGLGIGNFVIGGALEQIYMENLRIEKDRIIMRPFPQKIAQDETSEKRNTIWQQYRKDMISRAGIVIIIFGNKSQKGEVINANGVRSEFEIAKKMGKIIIPVGITGSISEEIWKEVSNDFKSFYPKNSVELKNIFNKLNDEHEKNNIIENIFNFIKELKN